MSLLLTGILPSSKNGDESSELSIRLEDYQIEESLMIYRDASSGTEIVLDGINHQGEY